MQTLHFRASRTKARQKSLGLKAFKPFKEQVTGNHKPLQYNTEAPDAIANCITEKVAASSKGTAKDLHSCLNAAPKTAFNTDDLYDSPWLSQISLDAGACEFCVAYATDNDSNCVVGIFPNERE